MDPVRPPGTSGGDVSPLADVRPATIRLPAGKAYSNLRVFVWPDRVEAWGIDAGAPVLRHVAAVLSIDTSKSPTAPARSKPWILLTPDGEWKVERGCGCSGGVPAALAAMAVPERVDA